MNVEPAAAWTTVWPAGLLLITFIIALVKASFSFKKPIIDRYYQIMLAIVIFAGIARIWFMPTLINHIYDGHEADYLEFFMGREPTRGGTVLYPAIQWFYFLTGKIFTGDLWPVFFGVFASLISIVAIMEFTKTLHNEKSAILAGFLISIWGNHAFWSSSAYNVMIPLAFSSIALFFLLKGSIEDDLILTLVAATSAVLAVLTRLESLIIAPFGFVLFFVFKPKRLLKHLAIYIVVAFLGVIGVIPLIFPGGMPGEGERLIAFKANIQILDYVEPFTWLAPFVLFSSVLVWQKIPRFMVALLVIQALFVHLVMCTFDDYGYRHALHVGIPLVIVMSIIISYQNRVLYYGMIVVMTTITGLNFRQISGLYYASDSDFIDSIPSGLPIISIDNSCTLVAEDPTIAENPALSHFNLLSTIEAQELFKKKGCLHWCEDVQDWRWSSRAVRDRAIRIKRMYKPNLIGRFQDPKSGYTCLLYDISLD